MAGRRRMGPDNNNWRGGRTVTPAGYVLIKMPEHPAADVRGYVYEHRVAMEAAIGRPVKPDERVRHRDNDPSNNDPANLVLVSPLDREERTSCACGCGTTMTRLDKAGRRRRYVSGHNSRRPAGPSRRPKAESGGGLPADTQEWLTEQFGGECAYGCGRAATCWDHLIPWSDGGSFLHAGNAVPSCQPCNSAKSDTDPWLWVERGMASAHAWAWIDLIGLALSWGVLENPTEEEAA